MKHVVQLNSDYHIRVESHQGVKHLIVPVVMMVEGVHHGNLGPLYHSADELGRHVESWNGIPVTIAHPQLNGNYVSANNPLMIEENMVGRVYNVHMDGSKLKGEVWINESAAAVQSSDILDYIRGGRQLEVSIGAFTDEDPVSGNWNGEQYTAIARNHRPDHLALLPGEEGACNWADGCGIRLNQKGGNMSKQHEPWDILLTNKTDYTELQNSIQTKLDSMDSEGSYHYLRALYDDSIVYEIRNESGAIFYKSDYSTNQDGSIEFGAKEPVRRNVEFVSTNADGSEQPMERTRFSNNLKTEGNSMSDNVKPCCPDKVEALIANERSKFTTEDKDYLLTLSAERLAEFEPEEVKAPEKVEPPQVNAEQAKEVLKESMKSPEDFIALLPEGMQDQMKSGLQLHQAKRTEMITAIQDNVKDTWTDDDLKGMNTETLTKVYKSVGTKVNYVPMGANETQVNSSTVAPLGPAEASIVTKKGE